MKHIKFREWAFLLTFLALSLAFIADVVMQLFVERTEAGKIAAAIRSLGAVYLIVKLGPWTCESDDEGGSK